MTISRAKQYPYPEKVDSIEDVKEYLNRLYLSLSEESGERMGDFDILQLGNVPWVDVREYGARGDGVTDDIGAINSAIKYIESLDSSGYRGTILFFPYGKYRISSTIIPTRRIIFQGVGGSTDSAYHGTIIFPDINTTGFTILACSPGMNFITIKDLCIVATGKDASGHGIDMSGRAFIENVYIDGFQGNGVNIVASSPADNANSWRMYNVRIDGCGGHGVFLDGTDVNAGVAIAVSTSNCGGWGFYDSSLYGATYIGCNASGNTSGEYKTEGASCRATFIGCYEEQEGTSSIVSPCVVLGGELAVRTSQEVNIAGAWIAPAFNAGNFTAGGSLAWTVEAGDIVTYAYKLIGKTMTVAFRLDTTSTSGTAHAELHIAIPGGHTTYRTTCHHFFHNDAGGGWSTGFVQTVPSGTNLILYKDAGGVGTWSNAASNNTYVKGTVTFEIS